MSLGIVVKGTEGLVLAADSRVTVRGKRHLPQGESQTVTVNYDNAKKVISFSEEEHSHVAAITFGEALIGQRTAHSFVPELEENELGEERVDIAKYARQLSEFYADEWRDRTPEDQEYEGPGMSFVVAGYNDGEAYGRVFSFNIPQAPDPQEQSEDEFGITYGGEAQIVNRLVKGMDPQLVPAISAQSELEPTEIWETVEQHGLTYTFPYEVLPLQDCIDLAILMVRTTIDVQGLALGVRGVGGKIEAATITRKEGVNFIQRKQLHGEQ